MPTYDYECEACGHTFEQWQSFHDDPLTKCPQCKKKKLKRLFGTGAAILFKGSGFYETDYRRDETYKAAEKADKDAATTAAKPETPATGTASTTPPSTPAPAPETPPAPDTGKGKGKKGKK